MRSCGNYRKYLNAYLDGELPTALGHAVEQHLADCPICRHEVLALRELEPLLAADPIPPMPAALASRIRIAAADRQQALQDRGGPRAALWNRREPLLQPWLLRGATSATFVLGLVLGASMGLTGGQKVDSAQRMSPKDPLEAASQLYAFDVLSATPQGSIEAAALTLLAEGG
ncbi:MAG: anti-sigma factor family protein [Halochromatium sp.]